MGGKAGAAAAKAIKATVQKEDEPKGNSDEVKGGENAVVGGVMWRVTRLRVAKLLSFSMRLETLRVPAGNPRLKVMQLTNVAVKQWCS